MAMTRISEGKRKHTWIANRAFTRMTGLKKVCLTCGQSNPNATKECPRPLGGCLESITTKTRKSTKGRKVNHPSGNEKQS